jgi:uracil-DNA glycosylase family 4
MLPVTHPRSRLTWEQVTQRIIRCRRCPRLAEYIRRVASEKVRRYRDEHYWGKPLAGFGDVNAHLLIVGLAPAAHGGTRTGRMFTGDSAGEWLMRALYETGFANQPTSVARDDGLVLRDAYLTASARCAPPGNRPTLQEIANCSRFLLAEQQLMPNVRVVLALGRIAFDTCLRYLYPPVKPPPNFSHNAWHSFAGHPTLVSSYHPSRQNTQTGRLRWEAWKAVFERIAEHLSQEPAGIIRT